MKILKSSGTLTIALAACFIVNPRSAEAQSFSTSESDGQTPGASTITYTWNLRVIQEGNESLKFNNIEIGGFNDINDIDLKSYTDNSGFTSKVTTNGNNIVISALNNMTNTFPSTLNFSYSSNDSNTYETGFQPVSLTLGGSVVAGPQVNTIVNGVRRVPEPTEPGLVALGLPLFLGKQALKKRKVL